MNGRIQGGADEDQSQWQDSLRPLCVPHQRNPCVQSRCWDVKREKKKGCSPSGVTGRKVLHVGPGPGGTAGETRELFIEGNSEHFI